MVGQDAHRLGSQRAVHQALAVRRAHRVGQLVDQSRGALGRLRPFGEQGVERAAPDHLAEDEGLGGHLGGWIVHRLAAQRDLEQARHVGRAQTRAGLELAPEPLDLLHADQRIEGQEGLGAVQPHVARVVHQPRRYDVDQRFDRAAVHDAPHEEAPQPSAVVGAHQVAG